MGCGASSAKENQEHHLLNLFIVRTHNVGTTKEHLSTMPLEKRVPFVMQHDFTEKDAKVVACQWDKIESETSAQQAKQAGVDIRTDVVLPQLDDPKGKVDRAKEIEDRRKEYKMVYPFVEGIGKLPPHVEDLPRAEYVGAEHCIELFGEHKKTVVSLNFNHALDMVHNLFVDEDPFKDWADLYRTTKVPGVVSRWREDREFAEQRFNGINPTLIRQVKPGMPILDKIPMTDELLKGVVPEGTTLQGLNDEGRLFVCDWEELDGLPAPPERYCCAPIALFYLDNDKKLMPLAIQLYQQPGPENPIFTPNPEHTSPTVWLTAKTHCQTSDAMLHEIMSHYLATHAYVEVIYIAMMRNLSVYHPISELIRPHFWFTMALNGSARKDLIAPGCAVPRLMACGFEGMAKLVSNAYTGWQYTRFDLPSRLEARGMGDKEKVPNYYYRDDGVRMFNIIKQYVKDLVADFYPTPELIAEDEELHNWIKELTGPELEMKGLPLDSEGRFSSQEQIATFLTGLIFTATAGHSMVNNGQWDYFGFVPNCPGTFRLKPPSDPKQVITEKQIAEALPTFTDTCDQIAIVSALSTRPTKLIGQYHKSFMDGRPNVKHLVTEFQRGLAELSKDIKERNAKLEVPYPYLDPEETSNCVDV